MRLILFLIILFSSQLAVSQKLTKTILLIKLKNKVYSSGVGFIGMRTKQYDRFVKLKTKASTRQLKRLAGSTNGALATYSVWALLERNETDLFNVFEKVYKNNNSFEGQFGCMISSSTTPEFFYRRYESLLRDSLNNYEQIDKQMFRLDSIIISNPKVGNNNLLKSALNMKTYEGKLLECIKTSGFEYRNYYALIHLSKYPEFADRALDLLKTVNKPKNDHW